MSTVPLASAWTRQLVEAERHSAGTDIRQAVATVARRLRRPPGTLWNLLFRVPKDVSHDLFMALQRAVELKIERQIKELEHELAAIRAAHRRVDPRVLAEAEESLARLKAALGGEG